MTKKKKLSKGLASDTPTRRPHDAVALWNRQKAPLCPGLGKKRRLMALALAFLTSDSYGFKPLEDK